MLTIKQISDVWSNFDCKVFSESRNEVQSIDENDSLVWSSFTKKRCHFTQNLAKK